MERHQMQNDSAINTANSFGWMSHKKKMSTSLPHGQVRVG